MSLQSALLIIAYILSGITLKIADFLGERENTRWSYLSAIICAFFFGLLISESRFSSSLLLGIIIGVSLSNKVDKPNLMLGLVITLLTAFYFGFKMPILWLLLVVALFTFIDEVGHDRLHSTMGVLTRVLRFRPALKLLMIVLSGLAQIQIIYLVSFLCFDLSYDLTNYLLTK